MKVKVVKRFIDKETKKLNEVGAVIEVTDARFKEISAAGKYVELIPGEAQGEKPLNKMKVDELKAYAEEKGIELNDANTKAEILAVIEAAEAAE